MAMMKIDHSLGRKSVCLRNGRGSYLESQWYGKGCLMLVSSLQMTLVQGKPQCNGRLHWCQMHVVSLCPGFPICEYNHSQEVNTQRRERAFVCVCVFSSLCLFHHLGGGALIVQLCPIKSPSSCPPGPWSEPFRCENDLVPGPARLFSKLEDGRAFCIWKHRAGTGLPVASVQQSWSQLALSPIQLPGSHTKHTPEDQKARRRGRTGRDWHGGDFFLPRVLGISGTTWGFPQPTPLEKLQSEERELSPTSGSNKVTSTV